MPARPSHTLALMMCSSCLAGMAFAGAEPENEIVASLRVSENWKKDLLAFCRDCKYQIESHPDPRLIRASIAVSHFDHTMEMAAPAESLTPALLEALDRACQSKRDFETGRCPDFVSGLNKLRLKRFPGASVAEFVMIVPENHSRARKWPLFLRIDPRRFVDYNHEYTGTTDMIDLWWHSLSPTDLQWKEYQDFLRVITPKLNIDEDRIYVDANCDNGITGMNLMLHYPDQFAEWIISAGNSYRHLAGNAYNLPFRFVTTGEHNLELLAYYDFAVKCFQYYHCPFFESLPAYPRTPQGHIPFSAVRKRSPGRVLFTADSLKTARAYWVQITARTDENFPATIDAVIDGQTITVATENVGAYRLNLIQAPLGADQPAHIVENGQSLGWVTQSSFCCVPEKYRQAPLLKNASLSGSIQDAFTEPYVVVYGCQGPDENLIGAGADFAQNLAARGAPCFSDANMPEHFLGTHNLVLIGTAQSNQWLAQINQNLPVQIDHGAISADGTSYPDAHAGFICIYPNPLNPDRYALVFAAASPDTMKRMPDVYNRLQSAPFADVCLFKITPAGDVRYHRREKFDTLWRWHDEWNRVLAVPARTHPQGQWWQWLADVIRCQLHADVAILENPFTSDVPLPPGPLTFRDFARVLRNYWIVKIQLQGQHLRPWVAGAITRRAETSVNTLVIDGLSVVQDPQGPSARNCLSLGQLQDSQEYTLALPYKGINGKRFGMLLKDYRLVDARWLLLLLKDYFGSTPKKDFDAHVQSIGLQMF